jgi:hypothetical protein
MAELLMASIQSDAFFSGERCAGIESDEKVNRIPADFAEPPVIVAPVYRKTVLPPVRIPIL